MKKISNTIKVIGIALVIGLGVSVVSAFTDPTGVPPVNNVPAVINTGAADQTKTGGIFSEKFMISDLGFFKKMLLPGNESWMRIGDPTTTISTMANIPDGLGTIPLTVDLTGRSVQSKGSTDGQNAIAFISGSPASCPTAATTIINDKASAFEFTSSTPYNATGHADLIARQMQLTGGAPAADSVLASVDTNGNAVWAKLVVQGGVLKVVNNNGQTISPVTSDASCTPPSNSTYQWVTLWSGCKYFDDAAVGNGYMENPSSNICKDQNNATVANSLCPQPAPGPRQAASSLPLCSGPASCQAYQVKANCTFGSSAVYIPNGCTKTNSVAGTCATGNGQEIYNIECSSPQTEQGISSGAAAAGFGATHLNNQNPQQCTGANAPMTAWMCHTAGTAQWVTAESRGEDITCTGPYLPTGTFSEGDIVCAENRPGLSLCKTNGTPNSTCQPGDSVCPN